MYEQKPWLKFYGDIPEHIDYPRVTMYEALMQTVSRSPEAIAYDFFGTTSTYRHPEVLKACVIGVPDEKQVQRVKGFVVLKDPGKASPETEAKLIAHCQEHLIRWSCPREIEFRSDLPCTLVGKIAFNTLEQQEVAKLKAEGKYCGE